MLFSTLFPLLVWLICFKHTATATKLLPKNKENTIPKTIWTNTQSKLSVYMLHFLIMYFQILYSSFRLSLNKENQ